MLDIIFIGLVILFFGLSFWYVKFCDKVGQGRIAEMSAEYVISGLIALALLVYLAYALLKPEKF